MDIFEPTKRIEVANGVVLVMRAPTAREMAEAKVLAQEINGVADAAPDDAHAMLYEKLPAFLSRLAVGLEGEAGIPSDWRERLIDWPYLRGLEGAQLFDAVCFRPYRTADLGSN